MKAIIMAGGEGKRLRPLTCDRPKPMVPLANKPVMGHAIELLKKHGFTKIGVTLQYMSSYIMDHYGDGKEDGVDLHYFIEDIPLGTAGSVKNAQSFLDETFIVISGDALTDIDLSSAVKFHKAKGSKATLVLTSVETPLKYGIVITKETGEIVRFLEKPSWGEVFSDKVNTGIYILEPEILEYIPPRSFFDFSKNLFPLLMEKGITLYGYTGKGYWCDIGNPEVYLKAHEDVLNKKVSLPLPYKEIEPGVWVGKNTDIHPEARLESPILIGNNCSIGPGVFLGSNTVIADNCCIEENSSLKKSILWNGVHLGRSTELRGAILCSNVTAKNHVSIFEGAVVGDQSLIEERATIKPKVKIWPNKKIEEAATVNSNLVWGVKFARKLFGSQGIKGVFNKDISLDLALKLGNAFGSLINPFQKIGVSCDGSPVSNVIKQVMVSGIQVSGHEVCDLGELTLPITRFAINNNGLKGGIYIKTSADDLVHLTFLNEAGANISKSIERKIENTLAIEDFRFIPTQKLKSINTDLSANLKDQYFRNLGKRVRTDIPLHIVINCSSPILKQDITKFLTEQGCNVSVTDKDLKKVVVESKADLGVSLDEHGENITLYDEMGNSLEGIRLKVFLTYLLLKKSQENSTIVAPVNAPSVLEKIVSSHNGKILYSKSSIQSQMEKMINQGEKGKEQFDIEFDGIQALLKVLTVLSENNKTLSQLIQELPDFYLHQDTLECPWEFKGKIIRSLVEKFKSYDHSNNIEGIKFEHPDKGWSLIIPDSEKPRVNIISEGSSMETAQELTDFYKDAIQELIR